MWFETYKSQQYKIEIKYPSNWQIKEQTKGTEAIFFLAPLESPKDVYRENLSVSVEPYTEAPLSLVQYSNRMILQLENHIQDFRLVKRNDITTLVNSPACLISFTGTQKDLQLKWLQTWAVKINNLYMITYTAETYRFNKYLKSVKLMIKSFRIL